MRPAIPWIKVDDRDRASRRESITVQHGESALDVGGRRTLLVLGSGLPVSYPLGTQGRVTIGRASDNLVEIDEPAVSRHHVVLHLGREVVLEDLGSSNGTRVAGRKLEPGTKMRLDPGVPVELGTAMLLVQDRAVARSPRRLWSWDYFEARLEEECRRAQRLGSSFATLHVRSTGAEAVGVIERRLGALLPRLDVVARYVPGEYEILLVGADLDEALANARSVAAGLGDGRVKVRIGHAVFPTDGRTPDELVAAAALRAEEDASTDGHETSTGPIAESPAMRELLRTIERVAADAIPVLVVGETGVGKELVADEIHRRSGRSAGPLVRLDGTSTRIDAALEPAADGSYELLQARGGTIVIDEVCALSPATQGRLARLLEVVERASATATDLPRFIATTNRDLEAEVAADRFRIELYHRLDGVTLVVPALRQRIDDIEPLAARFAEETAARIGRSEAPTLSELALARLQSYRWPGNVRELRNVVRRAVLLADGPVILPQHLPLEKLAASFAPDDDEDDGRLSQVREQFQAVERQRIIEALKRAGGNQTEAAKLLGIARRTLIKRLDLYDLPRPRKK